MKPIYIKKAEPRKRKGLLIFGSFALLLLGIRAIAPAAIETVINNSGADKKGYAFRVDDIDLKVYKAQMVVKGAEVFNIKNSKTFMTAGELLFDFDPLRLLGDKKAFSLFGDEVNVTISKDFVSEINRVKNEAKKKTDQEIYLEHVDADISTINVKEAEGENSRTILTLKDTHTTLEDFGIGSINENTEFKIRSKIAEGGRIDLAGKTKLEAKNTPWQISGEMKAIPSAVIEKLAGDKMPFDVTKANIDASIEAHSANGQIEGKIIPDIKDFKLSEKKEEGTVKRTVARAANYLFDKSKGKDEQVSFSLPFTLNENFTVNFPDTLEKITQ